MNKFFTFFQQPFTTQILLIKVSFLLCFAQLCVTILPLTQLITVFKLNRTAPDLQKIITPTAEKYITLIYWTVSTIQRNVPFMHRAKCLAQALTARHFLKKKQIPCTLLIGANIKEKNQLEAHAWLVHGNSLINFNCGNERFTKLTRFY